jgi:hypothetical protein
MHIADLREELRRLPFAETEVRRSLAGVAVRFRVTRAA